MAKNNGIPFYKMTGGGNDFVIFDNRKGILPDDYAGLAKKLCDRKFAIGADGLLAVEKCADADFRMIYYNSDGSRAAMCGNGARCIARFANLLKAAPSKMTFQTDAGLISAEVKNKTVIIGMSTPQDMRLDFPIKMEEDRELNLSFVNTGVPHAVLTVTDIEKTEVQELGRAIRYHKEFAPAGTNVNFVQVKDNHTLIVRTYERGVEGETLACGTGVTASSLIFAAKKMVESPVSCITRGGETLTIFFEPDGGGLPTKNVQLEGPAAVCFKGTVEV